MTDIHVFPRRRRPGPALAALAGTLIFTLPAVIGTGSAAAAAHGFPAACPWMIAPGSAGHPLSYWDTARHAWTTAPGTYRVQAGSSSQALRLSGSFQVTG